MKSTKNTPPETGARVGIVGTGSSVLSKLSRLLSGRKRWLVLVFIVVVILAIVGATLTQFGKQLDTSLVVLTVSGSETTYKLTEKQYAALLDQAKQQKVSPDRAKATIIKAYQYKIAAPQLKLEPSDEQIVRGAQTGAGYSGEGALNEWQQLSGYVFAAEGNIKIARTGGYGAALFSYPFDTVYYDDGLVQYDTNRDETAILAAKQSAFTQATGDRQRLVSNNTTADSIIDKLRKDPARTWAGGSNSSKWLKINTRGVTYTASESLTYSEPDYVMAAIVSLNGKPGVSDVREVSATVYGATQPDIIAYFFVSVTDVIAANSNIDSDLKQILNTIEVVDNAR